MASKKLAKFTPKTAEVLTDRIRLYARHHGIPAHMTVAEFTQRLVEMQPIPKEED